MFELWLDFIGDKLDELCEFCQDYYNYAAPSLTKSRTAYADDVDYAAQAGQASSWLRRRANFIFQRLQPQHQIAGDVDGDGRVTINDLTTLIDYLLIGKPNTYVELVGDMNNDGTVNISDVSDLIDMMLRRP